MLKSRIISFSLWGDNPLYTLGSIANCEVAAAIYPGWNCRFYTGDGIPSTILDRLNCLKNAELIDCRGLPVEQGYFWRFLAASEIDLDVMIS